MARCNWSSFTAYLEEEGFVFSHLDGQNHWIYKYKGQSWGDNNQHTTVNQTWYQFAKKFKKKVDSESSPHQDAKCEETKEISSASYVKRKKSKAERSKQFFENV